MSLPSASSSTADDQDTEASTLDKILVFLDDLKEKVMSLPLASSSTAHDQGTEAFGHGFLKPGYGKN